MKKSDEISLDIIFYFLYSFPNKRYLFNSDSLELEIRKDRYRKCLYKLGRHNLRIKHNIQEKDISAYFKDKRKFIDYFLNEHIVETNKGFYTRSYGTLEELRDAKEILLFLNLNKKRLKGISELEKKVLCFVFNIISTIKKKGHHKREVYLNDGSYDVYEMKSLGIRFNSNSKTGVVLIDFGLLNDKFNILFGESISSYSTPLKVEKTSFIFWRMGGFC